MTSVVSPIDYSPVQRPRRLEPQQRSALMVRYTQDSWKNDAPSIQANLWGDDPFPAVDSNWDQPSKSFVVSLNQTLGNTRDEHAAVLVLGQQDRDHARRRGSVDCTTRSSARCCPIFPYSSKQYGDETGAPVFWGGSGYPALWNEAPFLNNQDLFIIKDDYTKVFGKHFVKAGVLASFNTKNEDTDGNGSSQHSRFWGSAGTRRLGLQHRQHPRRLPAAGHDVRLLGSVGGPLGAAALARRRDVRRRLVAGVARGSRSTSACGTRCSTTRTRPTTRSRASCRRSSTRRSATTRATACCSRRAATGAKTPGARGGTDGPNRSLMEQDLNNFAPRLGFAWDVTGNGKTAVRGGIGQFFLRERLTPVLSIATNPPFVTTLSGIRKLDTTAEPCDGCFGSGTGAPTRGREVDMQDAEQLAVEPGLPAGSVRAIVDRGRLRRQLRLRPAEEPRREPGPERRHQRQRHGRPPGVRDHHAGQRRAAPVRRLRQQQHRRLGSHRQVDLSFAADAVHQRGSAAARSSRRRTPSPGRARTSR